MAFERPKIHPEVNCFKVRDFEIEYPTMMNGHLARNSFFVIPLKSRTKNSQFGIFYGNGTWASDYPEQLPKYLRDWLWKKAREHEYILVEGVEC